MEACVEISPTEVEMGTPQDPYGEPEKSEGLGKRVRRFVDSELNRFLEKDDREDHKERTGHPSDPDSAQRAGATASAQDSRRLHESDRTPEAEPTLEPDAHRRPEPVDVSHVGEAQRVGLLND